MTEARAYWDAHHHRNDSGTVPCDDWLQRFEDVIERCQTPVIDLGCGRGNDTKHLISRGKCVIACDFSSQAIRNIRKNFPEVYGTVCFDMTDPFPFEDNFTDLIIADLSLHYFSEQVTESVLAEIKRVLTPNGVLLFRVNSVKDFHYGAGQGTEVERNYFRTADRRFKRFFDLEDIHRFFGSWNILYLKEEQMDRYDYPKILWTAMCRAQDGFAEGKSTKASADKSADFRQNGMA